MSQTKKLKSLAFRLEEIKEQMDELLDEAKDVVRQADEVGDDLGMNLYESFKAYQYAHLKIRILGGEDSGYMSREEGIAQTVDQIREAAEEMKVIEENENES